jgi:hypothetical protein
MASGSWIEQREAADPRGRARFNDKEEDPLTRDTFPTAGGPPEPEPARYRNTENEDVEHSDGEDGRKSFMFELTPHVRRVARQRARCPNARGEAAAPLPLLGALGARLRCGSACHRISRAPAAGPTALRAQAQGVYCLEAAAELLIAQPWLRRADFTGAFLTVTPGLVDDRLMAVIDWPAVIAALDAGDLPRSGGERRMLRITASLADGIPVDLQDALTGIDDNGASGPCSLTRLRMTQRVAAGFLAWGEP